MRADFADGSGKQLAYRRRIFRAEVILTVRNAFPDATLDGRDAVKDGDHLIAILPAADHRDWQVPLHEPEQFFQDAETSRP